MQHVINGKKMLLVFKHTIFPLIIQQDNLPPMFKNELVIEREATLQLRPSMEALRREAQDLDIQIRQLQVKFIPIVDFK